MRTDVLRPLETTWEDWRLGGGLRQAFADPALPLEVEIGPGDDDFLLESALAHPGHNWLGIEYSRKRIRRYVRRVVDRAGELANLRLAWRPASDVVGPFLSPDVVRTYHVYFPDPWPKKHHHRYRLVNPAFLSELGSSLEPGGVVKIATDHRDYVEEILESFGEVEGFENAIGGAGYEIVSEAERTTAFERRWRAEGLPIHRLEFAWSGR